MSFHKKHVTILLLLPLLVLWGIAIHAEQEGVVDTYKKATDPVAYDSGVDAESVAPRDTVRVAYRYRGGRFWTDSRKGRIERFRCSRCHNNDTVSASLASEIAHGSIRLDHGGEDKPLDCLTCHDKDERDYLVTEKGVKVDMDHSYQICSQCHFRQNRDWVGGAHGKRIGYWVGKRVVQNCASCHDPHTPHFEKRWPITYSPPSDR